MFRLVLELDSSPCHGYKSKTKRPETFTRGGHAPVLCVHADWTAEGTHARTSLERRQIIADHGGMWSS